MCGHSFPVPQFPLLARPDCLLQAGIVAACSTLQIYGCCCASKSPFFSQKCCLSSPRRSPAIRGQIICDARLRLGYQLRLGGVDSVSMCRRAPRCATRWTSSRQICCAPRAWSGFRSTASRLPWTQTPGPSSQKSQQQLRAFSAMAAAPLSTAAASMLRSAPAAGTAVVWQVKRSPEG